MAIVVRHKSLLKNMDGLKSQVETLFRVTGVVYQGRTGGMGFTVMDVGGSGSLNKMGAAVAA